MPTSCWSFAACETRLCNFVHLLCTYHMWRYNIISYLLPVVHGLLLAKIIVVILPGQRHSSQPLAHGTGSIMDEKLGASCAGTGMAAWQERKFALQQITRSMASLTGSASASGAASGRADLAGCAWISSQLSDVRATQSCACWEHLLHLCSARLCSAAL